MEKIGIIEDEPLLNQALKIALEKEGFQTLQAFSVGEGRRLAKEKPDLYLVDINLPDGDGIRLCREILGKEQAPVIFLTGRDQEEDMLEAFQAGADDYVVKPFPMRVLMKRVQAVLRRSREEKESFSYGGLEIDFPGRRVSLQGKPVFLTPKEYRLLELFARNKGRILTKEQILEQVWDMDGMFVGENTVSVTVNRLRKKLAPLGETLIENIFGQGYRMGT